MTLKAEMWDYHVKNPHIYAYVDRFAKEAIAAGYTKFAIATIWERIRWEIRVTVRDMNFKMPNNHRAYYARYWMSLNPEYPAFFETCMLRSVVDAPVDRFGRTLEEETECIRD